MLTKNTLIDLWSMLSDIPTVINGDNLTVLDEDFLGWPAGTDVETIWHWFDDQYADFGGVHALMYDNPQPERKFQVWTPHGILECYAKHEGKDSGEDYPGVYIDLRVTDEQKTGKVVGDLICCVEYNSAKDQLQIVPYADIESDEPTLGGHCDPESGITVVTGYEGYLPPYWPDKKADDGEGKLPERISMCMIRRGLTDGDIVIDDGPDGGYAAFIGEHWFYFVEDDPDICAEAYKDTTYFEDSARDIWAAINDEPINGPDEDSAAECLYYKAFLEERFEASDALFKGDKIDYPIEEQINACYAYLNWTGTHKNAFQMTEEELLEAKKELADSEPGIAWVAHAGYAQAVPQDKRTGFLILS